jgi:hypothetical protein
MKYVAIKLVGLERVKAFENTEKTDDKQPDYKADGVAVWMNETKKDK